MNPVEKLMYSYITSLVLTVIIFIVALSIALFIFRNSPEKRLTALCVIIPLFLMFGLSFGGLIKQSYTTITHEQYMFKTGILMKATMDNSLLFEIENDKYNRNFQFYREPGVYYKLVFDIGRSTPISLLCPCEYVDSISEFICGATYQITYDNATGLIISIERILKHPLQLHT